MELDDLKHLPVNPEPVEKEHTTALSKYKPVESASILDHTEHNRSIQLYYVLGIYKGPNVNKGEGDFFRLMVSTSLYLRDNIWVSQGFDLIDIENVGFYETQKKLNAKSEPA